MSEFVRWENELYHHGILGQKWGIRRFQNEDGTWTKAGLRQRAKLERYALKQNTKIERARLKEKKKRTKLNSRTRMKDLTNEELQKRIDRMIMEKEYKELHNEVSGITAGKKLVERFLNIFEEHQENKLRSKELDVKALEARSRVKQAKQNAKQAKQNAEQSKQQAKRSKRDREINLKKANTINKKMELIFKRNKNFDAETLADLLKLVN